MSGVRLRILQLGHKFPFRISGVSNPSFLSFTQPRCKSKFFEGFGRQDGTFLHGTRCFTSLPSSNSISELDQELLRIADSQDLQQIYSSLLAQLESRYGAVDANVFQQQERVSWSLQYLKSIFLNENSMQQLAELGLGGQGYAAILLAAASQRADSEQHPDSAEPMVEWYVQMHSRGLSLASIVPPDKLVGLLDHLIEAALACNHSKVLVAVFAAEIKRHSLHVPLRLLNNIMLGLVNRNVTLPVFPLVHASEVIKVFTYIMARGSGVEPDQRTFEYLVRVFAAENKRENVHTMFLEMNSRGIRPSLNSYNNLMHCYARGGLAAEVLEVLKALNNYGLSADTDTYTAMMVAAQKKNNSKQALSLYERMKGEAIPLSYNVVHNLFIVLRKEKKLTEMTAILKEVPGSLKSNPKVYMEIMKCCVDLKNSRLLWQLYEEAKQTGREIPKDIYAAALAGTASPATLSNFYSVLQDMEESGAQISSKTYAAIFSQLVQAGSYDVIRTLASRISPEQLASSRNAMFRPFKKLGVVLPAPTTAQAARQQQADLAKAFALMRDFNVEPTRLQMNRLLMIVQKLKLPDKALEVFDILRQSADQKPDEESYNLLLGALVGHAAFWQSLGEMELAGVKASPFTWACVLEHANATQDTEKLLQYADQCFKVQTPRYDQLCSVFSAFSTRQDTQKAFEAIELLKKHNRYVKAIVGDFVVRTLSFPEQQRELQQLVKYLTDQKPPCYPSPRFYMSLLQQLTGEGEGGSLQLGRLFALMQASPTCMEGMDALFAATMLWAAKQPTDEIAVSKLWTIKIGYVRSPMGLKLLLVDRGWDKKAVKHFQNLERFRDHSDTAPREHDIRFSFAHIFKSEIAAAAPSTNRN